MNQLLLRLLISLCILLSSQKVMASGLDSLRIAAFESGISDSLRVDLLNNLAFRYHQVSGDSALFFARMGLELARKINYANGRSAAYRVMAITSDYQVKYEMAQLYLDSGLYIARSSGNRQLESDLLNGKGIVYSHSGTYDKAIDRYLSALEIKKQINDIDGIRKVFGNLTSEYERLGQVDPAYAYLFEQIDLRTDFDRSYGIQSGTLANIGHLMLFRKDYDSAAVYFERAIAKMKGEFEDDNSAPVAYASTALGKAYAQLGNYDQAVKSMTKAFRMFEKLEMAREVGSVQFDLAEVYLAMESYDLAIRYAESSLEIREPIGYGQYLVSVYSLLAQAHHRMNLDEEATRYARQALESADKIQNRKQRLQALMILQEIYFEQQNFEKAYQLLLAHNRERDSLISEQKIKEIQQLETYYSFETLRKEQALNQKDLNQKKALLRQQQVMLISFAVGITLLIAVVILVIRYNRRIKRMVRRLQDLNDKIQDQRDEIIVQKERLDEANLEISAANASLEQQIAQRTERLQKQNERLRQYSHSNSHLVRAPLSRLLGLINVLELGNLNEDEKKELIKNVLSSAHELDEIIKGQNRLLESED